MSKKKDYKPEDIAYPEQKIVEIDLQQEMQSAYLEYAMSVIVGRALPDVRDGLKPVHRRILYAMYEDNLTSDKPFKKSATCVGDVLGRYHPHGDASVYDALVRLAQDFSMRYMLVDGHGNFGSIDGDPPAAYRYTEARLSKIANEMLRDIDKDTVDWDPNFDESRKEPRVLPSRFPNLLVNGTTGIAVGMTTNIPPHNLGEVIDGAVCVLDNPNATLSDLMKHIKGPDFPTKGIIVGTSGIKSAYATGRGKIVVRAKTELEEFGSNRTRIIVTELPYQVNKARLVSNIADQVHEKRLDGISGLRDESDREGMRIVIELKRDANPQVVLNRLFNQTAMQSNFSVIMLALVHDQKQPKILTLREVLDEYLAHQMDVLTRRTIYDKKKAEARAHLLEGLLIAQDNIDEVIKIIRESYDDAKENLMVRFGLDEVQTQAILDMQLKRLQGLEHDKLQAEYDELEEKIAYYESLLADREKMKGVLRTELLEIRDKFADERKTEIELVENEIDVEDLIEEENCVFTLTHNGYLKRTPVSAYRVQKRGGRGVKDINTREEDYIENLFTCSTHDNIMFFTDKGRVYVKKGYQIPEAGRNAKGVNIINFISIDSDEKVKAMIHSREFSDDEFIFFATKNGTVKRIESSAMQNIRNAGLKVITIEEGNELIAVRRTSGNEEVMLMTKQGLGIRFNEQEIRATGRTAMGVRGIKLYEGDDLVGCEVVGHGENILVVTEKGYGKRVSPNDFTLQSRGGYGKKSHKITEKTGDVAACAIINEDQDIMLISSDGIMIRTPASNISVFGRNSSGVKLMNIDGDAKIIAIAKTDSENSESDAESALDSDSENLPEDEVSENNV